MKISFKAVLNYLTVAIVFSGAWSYYVESFAELRGLYFILLISLLFWLPFLRGAYFHKYFIFFFFILVAASFYNILAGNNSLTLLMKQVMGIFFSSLVFYLLIKINDYDVKAVFKIYLNMAFIVALIGVIQEVSYLLKFKPGYDYRGILPGWNIELVKSVGLVRVNSILPEASHFCNVMMPAFFVSLTSFLKNSYQFQKKRRSVVIIISFFLSFSIGGLIGALFAIILLFHNNKKFLYIVLCVFIICGIGYYTYANVYEVRTKIDNSLEFLSGKKALERADLTTYAFFSNALIAYNSFKDNPFFGHGLGSHWMSYDRYMFNEKIVPATIHRHILCRGDAGSLFLRLVSETGLFGVMAFFVFLARYHITKSADGTGYLWIINNAVLCMFFLKLLRMGNYFIDGLFLFFWLYYFSKIELKALSKDRRYKYYENPIDISPAANRT